MDRVTAVVTDSIGVGTGGGSILEGGLKMVQGKYASIPSRI